MNANGSMEQRGADVELSNKVRKRMIQVVVQSALMAAILFATAGTLRWTWAWVYLGVGLVILAANSTVMPRELIAERGSPKENAKVWDKTLTGIMLVPTIAVWVVSGLDHRHGWSQAIPVPIHLLGVAAMVMGQGLFTWAMVSNRFFSTLVRLQIDRSHVVATGGPYRWVRHPGYVGYLISGVAAPIIFGSLWGLVPAVVVSVLMVVRTALEDRTLQAELAGYREYAERVRYRLLPGVW